MTKEDLFKNYNVNESHAVWDDGIDNVMSVEIFRIMHGGRLPSDEDKSIRYVVDFNRRVFDLKYSNELRQRKDYGSLFLTSKRMIYKYADFILDLLNPVLNPDFVISEYNRKNPTFKEYDREILAEVSNCTTQTLSNYKTGDTPDIMGQLWEICERYEMDLPEFVYADIVNGEHKVFLDVEAIHAKMPEVKTYQKNDRLAEIFNCKKSNLRPYKIGNMPKCVHIALIWLDLAKCTYKDILIFNKHENKAN